ncbi:hypothetical protein A9Q85_07595 [Cycloclasticus sp. 44_32_T64]|nr:hypothetical protein A9Q85_07595 [Cycloclasticus sp. 44_32_T64]
MEYRKSNKRARSYATRVIMTLVAFLAITSHTSVYAQKAGSQEELVGCIFSLEGKRILFAAYQPHIDNKRLCRKLPGATGATYFSLDLVDKPLRERALKIRVTTIKQGDTDLQSASPIVDFEVASSPSGVVDFEHDFNGAKGHYRLEVINEMDNTQGGFNFEVGAEEFKWKGKFGQRVAFGMFGGFALVGLGYLAFRKKKA